MYARQFVGRRPIKKRRQTTRRPSMRNSTSPARNSGNFSLTCLRDDPFCNCDTQTEVPKEPESSNSHHASLEAPTLASGGQVEMGLIHSVSLQNSESILTTAHVHLFLLKVSCVVVLAHQGLCFKSATSSTNNPKLRPGIATEKHAVCNVLDCCWPSRSRSASCCPIAVYHACYCYLQQGEQGEPAGDRTPAPMVRSGHLNTKEAPPLRRPRP